VLHLLYSRFWHKVLFDRGHVSTPEPFQKLVNQGMILGEPDENGKAEKMSKSRGNVINPDDIVQQYGADSLRLYEMFMGPLEQTKPWQMSGVEGVFRFLGRVWRMMIDDRSEDVVLISAVVDTAPPEDQLRILHKTIKAVTDDIDRLSFNTAISRMMEFTNFMSGQETRSKSVLENLCSCSVPSLRILRKNCGTLWAIPARCRTNRGHRMTRRCWWKTLSRSRFSQRQAASKDHGAREFRRSGTRSGGSSGRSCPEESGWQDVREGRGRSGKNGEFCGEVARPVSGRVPDRVGWRRLEFQ
jgi:hypothetical protein